MASRLGLSLFKADICISNTAISDYKYRYMYFIKYWIIVIEMQISVFEMQISQIEMQIFVIDIDRYLLFYLKI